MGFITHTGSLFEFPSPLGAAANWLSWVQHVVRVPHGGLPHVLRRRHAQRHHLNRLLQHAVRRLAGS